MKIFQNKSINSKNLHCSLLQQDTPYSSKIFEGLSDSAKNYFKSKQDVFRITQFYPELFQKQSKNHIKLQDSALPNALVSTSSILMEKFLKDFPELAKVLSESIHNINNSVVYVINNCDVSMFKLDWVLNKLSDEAASELSNMITNGTFSEVIARFVFYFAFFFCNNLS